MSPIEILAEADEEIASAIDWYLERDPAAAERFAEELKTAIGEIAAHPNRWSKHLYGTRHLRLKKFPYYVVYRAQADGVVILAVPSVSQRRGYWKNRQQPGT